MPVLFHDAPMRTHVYGASDNPSGLSEYVAASAGEAWSENPVSLGVKAINQEFWRTVEGDPYVRESGETQQMPDTMTGFVQTGEIQDDTGKPLREGFMSALDATTRAKDEFGTDLRFEGRPVSEREFKRKVEHKQAQEARDLIYATAPKGVGVATLGFLTQMAVSAVDPINVASAFVPFVREARFAALSARWGVTNARMAKGVVEGAAGAAILEPGIYAAHQYLADPDYGIMDSLTNIAVGAGLGAGLHTGFGKISDYFARKVDGETQLMLQSLSQEQRLGMLSVTTNQVLNGYLPSGDKFMQVIGKDRIAKNFSKDVIEIALTSDTKTFMADVGSERYTRLSNDNLLSNTKLYYEADTKIGTGDNAYDLTRMLDMYKEKYEKELAGINLYSAKTVEDFDAQAKIAGAEYETGKRPATAWDNENNLIIAHPKADQNAVREAIENAIDRAHGRVEGMALRYDRDDFTGHYIHRQIVQAAHRDYLPARDAQGNPLTGENFLRDIVDSAEAKPLLDGSELVKARDQALAAPEETQLDRIVSDAVDSVTQTIQQMQRGEITQAQATRIGEFNEAMAKADKNTAQVRTEAKWRKAFAVCMGRG